MRPLVTALSALTALGVATVAPCVADACEPVTLTTYNTAFIVAPADTEDNFHRPAAERAGIIADQLLAERPDVIALQEVFDTDASNVFEQKLKATYPFYVKYLDAHDELNPNELHGDSGLMLFSRLPFLPFDGGPLAGDVKAFANGRKWRHVQFQEFAANRGSDWWANKGVGMVKILGPCERQLAVAFTHLQASYDGDDDNVQARAVQIRAEQLIDVREMLWFGLSNTERDRVEMYVLGDLNIDANPNTAPPSGDSEWQTHFDPNRAGDPFFKTTVTETWPVEPDRRDVALTEGAGMPTFTDPKDGHRFDYVLRRPAPQAMATCLQHLRVDHAVGVEPNGTALSDHLPITASTHQLHDFCSPHTARRVTLPDEWINDNLWAPGMMQWHRIDEPGSYTMDVFGPDMAFDVYEASDLSRPLRPTRPLREDAGWRFTMPEAPFYVRVRGSSRTAQGAYALHVHKNQGGHPGDAIMLLPAVPDHYTEPSMPLNWEHAVWFTFTTDVSDNGELPALRLHLASFFWPYELELYDRDQNRIWDPTLVGSNGSWPYQSSGRPLLLPGDYFVKAVPWWNWVSPGAHVTMVYETTLTYATPDTVACHTQDDNLGDDDIWLHLFNDNRDRLGGWRYLREFDNNDNPHPMAASGVTRQRFNQTLYVELWDADDGPNANDLVGLGWIPALSTDDAGAHLHISRWRWPASDYSMRWFLSHNPQSKCRLLAGGGCSP